MRLGSRIQDINKHESIKYNIPIIPLSQMKELYEKQKFDMIVLSVSIWNIRDVYLEAVRMGIDKVYVIPQYVYHNNVKQFFYELDCKKPLLEYYEFHVCDHCNLNCKGCGHVSNACEPYFPDLDQYKNDISRLKELFSGVMMIKLLGGEPLLNEHLIDFIKITREKFPECDLRIGTNGLLVPKASKELFDVMKKTSSYFFISLYPPIEKMKKQIFSICRENGVNLEFTTKIDKFSKRLYLNKEFDRVDSYKKCKEDFWYCFTLRDGRISPCATFYFRKLNEIFNTDFEITDEDDFDIYQIQDGWILDRLLHTPIPFCEYCGKQEEFIWEIGNKEPVIDDYIVKQGAE